MLSYQSTKLKIYGAVRHISSQYQTVCLTLCKLNTRYALKSNNSSCFAAFIASQKPESCKYHASHSNIKKTGYFTYPSNKNC